MTNSIEVVTFTGPDGVEACRADIELLIQQFGTWDADFVDWVALHPEILTLVYVDSRPAAYMRIDGFDVGKDSLEFSGCVLPAYHSLGLTNKIAPTTIAKAFMATGKRKMLAVIKDDNRAAQTAIVSLGFKRVGRDANKDLMYLLNRTTALAKAHKQTA